MGRTVRMYYKVLKILSVLDLFDQDPTHRGLVNGLVAGQYRGCKMGWAAKFRSNGRKRHIHLLILAQDASCHHPG